MVRTFEDWIKLIIGAGELCSTYQDKVDSAVSNKKLVDLVMDANGMSFLCEMQSKGMPLPYEVITRRFGCFINGRYIGEHKTEKGRGYTSAIYCCYEGVVRCDTTLLTLLGCRCDLYVKSNHILQVYADSNTSLNVICPETSKAIVHYWGGGKPAVKGNVELIKEG